MPYVIVLMLLIVIIPIIVMMLTRKPNNKNLCKKNDQKPLPPEHHTYTTKKLITTNEKYFYDILMKHFNGTYIVLPQVSLRSILEKNEIFLNKYQNELFRIVDFVIFTKDYEPLLIIEINDKTHLRKDRQIRDLKVQQICNDANIKIVKFWTSYQNKEQYIVNRIKKELNETK